MIARGLRCALVALAGCLTLSAATYAQVPRVTYVNMGRADPSAIRIAPGETIRFRVVGSACRRDEFDSPPTVSEGVIEFTLAFNAGCFATPPSFSWSSDLVAPAAGVYEVRYFRHTVNGVSVGAKTLVDVRRVIVGPRPDAHADAGAGTTDRSFGSDGALQLPGYGLTGRIMARHPDGAVFLVSSSGIRILDDGAIDDRFPDPSIPPDPIAGWFPRSIAIASQGDIWLAGTSQPAGTSRPRVTVRRFDGSGRGLSSSVVDASAFVPAPHQIDVYATVADIATFPDGKAVVVGHAKDVQGPASCAGHAFAARYRVDGTLDSGFGSGGIVSLLIPGCIVRVSPARNGGSWLLGTYDTNTPASFLLKLDAVGSIDTTFGQAGIVFGSFARANPVEHPDGRVVLGGVGFHLIRLLANGLVDRDFGVNGVVANPTYYDLVLQDLAMDGNGGLVVVGVWSPGQAASGLRAFRPVVLRYAPDQTWDKAFGEDGIHMPEMLLAQPTPNPVDALTLLPVDRGAWLVAGIAGPVAPGLPTALYVHRFRGVADSSRAPVTEYFHAGLDHYFYTADPTEISILDQGTIPGWTRTGETFNAYANLPGDASPVCRFFSASFAPKSSHFYTGNVVECAAVGAMPAWTREGVVFALPLPDANGACPFGTRRVYRAYNNGMGGAPAHRLTTNVNTRYAMESAGWIREGNGFDGVTLCAPN